MSVQSTQKPVCLEVRGQSVLEWNEGRAVCPFEVCLPKVSPWCGVGGWRQGVCGSTGMGVERVCVGGGAAICEPVRGGTIRPKAAVATVGLGQVSVVLPRSWEEGTAGPSWGRVNVSGGRGRQGEGRAGLSVLRSEAGCRMRGGSVGSGGGLGGGVVVTGREGVGCLWLGEKIVGLS